MNALKDQRPALRVALFSGNYDYVRDGANQALNRWVDFLERNGVAVRVYSPTAEKAAFDHAGTLISVPSIAIPRRPEYRFALGMPRSIKQDLADFNPNVIHLSAPDLLGYSALRVAKKWKIPAIASVHTRFESYLKYYKLAWLEKYVVKYLCHFYRQCAGIFAPTPEVAATLRHQGVPDNVGVWSRGVDGLRFNPAKRCDAWRKSLGFASTDVVVLFVGRLVLEKGLCAFAETINELRRRNVACRPLIVGDGPEMKSFKQLLPDGLFTGFLQGDDLARAYASADIFFNPSVTEAFGNVTLEAMASGLPCVCAAGTGNVSLVTDGVTGLLSPNRCPKEYAGHISTLTKNDDTRRAMGAAAQKASTAYVWDSVMVGLLRKFQDIVRHTRPEVVAESAQISIPDPQLR